VEVQAVPAPSGEDRIATIPNLISGVRLACVPLFLYLLLGAEARRSAAVLLATLGATDWVDGYIARRWNQVSTLGKVLDPVADRVVLLVGVVAILLDGAAPLWVGIASLGREALISIGTVVVAALGGRRIDVSRAGKAGTFLTYFAYPLFLAGDAGLGSRAVWRGLAWTFVLPGVVLSWWALGTYVPAARRALQRPRRQTG
jgi:cardiolipin synthase